MNTVRAINDVSQGMNGCEACIDDVILYSDSWKEHLQIIREFFNHLDQSKLTINLAKNEFSHALFGLCCWSRSD